ncbi:histidyl-tRNA synthetase [Acholeplasma hippikon]|uniref:Histidine--tRNA ligase n=2 Tax=Acholeplasma hippikon TaxID=264636 RepID=A0A449BJ94_9MOLU|nr:histidyl-tRNA synthetase [Acholeplasma hippikon]
MEYSDVFHRENEGSDMVTKETYNFKDKGDRNLTLRPEGTAGVIRSFIENKLYAQNDLTKLFYIGPNFRYERPQKGRFRQFMQFGVEALGTNNPYLDAEVLALAYETIRGLGLKGVVVKINSLGNDASKAAYKEALYNYLLPYKDQLSEDSQVRLEKNPLRILDSKVPVDKEITKNAPLPLEYLDEESRNSFETITRLLDQAKIPYALDRKLVRGLDYYSHIVFEIQAEIEGFGSQNALGGGGRYDNLVSELGGPKTPGIGFAFGMERLLNALEIEGRELAPEPSLDAFFVTFDEKSKDLAFNLQNELRVHGFSSDLNYTNKNFKSQLKEALNHRAKFLVIIGENEVNEGVVNLKNTSTEEQIKIRKEELVNKLKELL